MGIAAEKYAQEGRKKKRMWRRSNEKANENKNEEMREDLDTVELLARALKGKLKPENVREDTGLKMKLKENRKLNGCDSLYACARVWSYCSNNEKDSEKSGRESFKSS
ncbi:hypothetical protein K0M31_008565 [Melipona bicolor]|uniref:Uncharacterized protein n=1 Tax=Melipona bicolor TaxID=60889 RepID=A0AA40KK22_9HYME|nr:hypothetical protein K0M31_008565 [Melipona bicolor]